MTRTDSSYTVSQKNVHLWLAITLTHVNGLWHFFGRNVTDKVSNRKTLYCVTSNNLCFCIKKNTKIAFLLKCCICALPEFNHLLDFFNLFDSRLIPTLLCDSLNLVINAFSSKLLAAWLRLNEVESAAHVGLCCTHNAPAQCLLGFLFRKVMQKHYMRGGKTKHHLISYFISNTAVTHLPKIIVIGSCESRLQQITSGRFFEIQCSSQRVKNSSTQFSSVAEMWTRLKKVR